MNGKQLKEYKLGQQQGTHDFFNGPHKRFSHCGFEKVGWFAAGYIQSYDLAQAEQDHSEKNDKYFD
jgi:hypothetical protein